MRHVNPRKPPVERDNQTTNDTSELPARFDESKGKVMAAAGTNERVSMRQPWGQRQAAGEDCLPEIVVGARVALRGTKREGGRRRRRGLVNECVDPCGE